MNQNLMKRIAQQELIKRDNEVIPDVLQECLPYQLEFIKNSAKRKVICSTRRSAKTFCIAIYLIYVAITTRNAKLAYLTLTNDSAKRIIWGQIIEVICLKYGIKAELNSKYEIKFENGSILYLYGMDATPKQKNRLRGNAFDLVCIDEAQDFTQDLKEIVQDVLKMTLAQTGATLCMVGTPGSQMGLHYFWEINKPNSKETEWTRFFFDWRKNTSIDPKSNMRVCDAIQYEVDKDIELNPLIAETPSYKREILGQWVIETDNRVYKSQEVNYIDQLPGKFLQGCSYILSLDLGYHDATAFVVSAFNKRFDNNMYVIRSFKESKLTITGVASKIKELMRDYSFQTIVIDAANTQAVEEMRQIHSLPLEAAEKLGKEGHIALVNSDLITRNIYIVKPNNSDLIKELETLIWDHKALMNGKYKEDAKKENHLTDAFLYGHHASRHYWYSPKVEPLPIEDQVIVDIEKQLGFNKPKMKSLRRPWYDQ